MTTEVKPVPDGFHTLTPSLIVNDAAKAIEFYKTAFGAEERGRSNTPDGRIMHAELKIGDSILFLNDEFPEFSGQCQSTFTSASPVRLGGRTGSINLYVESADDWFNRAVSAGATVVMPLMDAFWGDRYGMVEDPFGHVWGFATHIKDVTPEEVERASAEIFSQPEAKSAGQD
jgi:uncharacterized glyoxalase superfamily protein PhnB